MATESAIELKRFVKMEMARRDPCRLTAGRIHHAGQGKVVRPTRSGQWNERILYSFSGGTDGQYPSGSLTLDAAGNLYGATSNGGQHGSGVIFEIAR